MPTNSTAVPRYRDLPVLPTGHHHAWDVFGPGDELGTLNFLSPSRVRQAAGLVRDGQVVDLSLPLDLPSPPLNARGRYDHVVDTRKSGRDDHLDNFYPQGSTQWDGLQHIRYREFGYYGGRDEQQLDDGELGIAAMASHGIVGRGILVDVAGWLASRGEPLAPDRRRAITASDLDEVLAWESCAALPGDILLVRTGWVEWYLNLPDDQRAAVGGTLHPDEGGLECPGLAAGEDTAEWLWDHQIAAVAVDNPAVEALRVRRDEGFLHRLLVALLGMPLGELWDFGDLSRECARRGRYEFMFSSVPLKIPSGVGSTGNGVAIL